MNKIKSYFFLFLFLFSCNTQDEITRAHKCADLMKKGFMYRHNTPNAKLCQDIVPIVKVKPPKKEKKFLLF